MQSPLMEHSSRSRVEVSRHNRLEQRSSKHLDEMQEKDRISALPDQILIHILSFMHTKDAICTGILSRRWRGLWTFTPNLYFDDDDFDDCKKFIKFVDRSLIRHVARKIKKFCLWFYYNEDVFTYSPHHSRRYASHVDAWIHDAVVKGVEELSLNNYEGSNDFYGLPSPLLKCETLTSLKLRTCNAFRSCHVICFSSLRVLSLKFMELPRDLIQGFLDGCPLLEDFKMRNCALDDGRLLRIASSTLNLRLHRLTIGEIDQVRMIDVQAPHLQILNLSNCIPNNHKGFDAFKLQVPSLQILNVSLCISNADVEYSLKDMLLLKEAYLDLTFRIIDPDKYHSKFYYVVLSMLKDLCHAKVLKLSKRCVQLMSISLSNDLHSFVPMTKCLKIEVGLHKFDLPGIAYLLKSSCDLETLVIKLGSSFSLKFDQESLSRFDFDEREYWESLTFTFPCLERHLKTVEISGFMGQCESRIGSCFEEKLEKEIQLVSFLLKNALVLEKMNIIVSSKPYSLKEEEWVEFRSTAAQKVKALSKAASCAEVLLIDE